MKNWFCDEPSASGSHVTQVAVVTNSEEKNKSALYNSILYPNVSIVDPELMLTMPEHITACTGFDVFAHAFESLINSHSSPYTELLSLEAIRIAAADLLATNAPELSEAFTIEAWVAVVFLFILDVCFDCEKFVILVEDIGFPLNGLISSFRMNKNFLDYLAAGKSDSVFFDAVEDSPENDFIESAPTSGYFFILIIFDRSRIEFYFQDLKVFFIYPDLGDIVVFFHLMLGSGFKYRSISIVELFLANYFKIKKRLPIFTQKASRAKD